MDLNLGSMAAGAVLPYVVMAIAIGIRKKSAKAGVMVAWGMAVATVGMFSKHVEIHLEGEKDG